MKPSEDQMTMTEQIEDQKPEVAEGVQFQTDFVIFITFKMSEY